MRAPQAPPPATPPPRAENSHCARGGWSRRECSVAACKQACWRRHACEDDAASDCRRCAFGLPPNDRPRLDLHFDTLQQLRSLQSREISSDDYELLYALHKLDNKPRTLGHDDIARLGSHLATASSCCAVCMGEIEVGDAVRRLPCAAAHEFHVACIDEWLTCSAARCPVDQQELFPR